MAEGFEIDDLACDVLLFVATQSEREQLEAAASGLSLPFDERQDARVGTYFSLGTIGSNRVRAMKTRMGPFFYQGSASQAIILRAATSATSIIQLGMAFTRRPSRSAPRKRSSASSDGSTPQDGTRSPFISAACYLAGRASGASPS